MHGGRRERRSCSQIERLAPAASAIVLSDYLKGVISKRVAAAAIAAAKANGIPITVDPKVPHTSYYAGATLVTPNHHEAAAVTHMRLRTDEETAAAARRFRESDRLRERPHHARRAGHVAAHSRG